MKILLVYPEFPDTFWSFKHAIKFIGKKALSPPLGLLTVAALLPEDWELRLVDLNVRPRLKNRDLAWADMVFVSAMTVQRSSVRAVIARCKAAGVKVTAGGPLFVTEHAEFPEVDHFVLNEAELTLPRFLKDLEAGAPGRLYETADFADLSKSPAPRWDLLDLKRYASMSLQYSRGCPFNCDFCNVTALLGRRVRTKSAPQVTAELDALHACGWRSGVFFVDDNFIGNKVKLKRDLLPALVELQKGRKGLSFITEASINLADDAELMEMMVEAGFDTVFVGIETPDDACLRECKKGQNTGRDLVADVKRIQQAGLQVQAGFIVGFDSDTPSIFQRQIDFIQKSGIPTAMVGLLQAIPGTRLFKRIEAENRLSGVSSGDNVDGTTNIITRMAPKILRDGYIEILEHIYAPGNYYSRLKTFLREMRTRKTKGRLSLSNLFAFFKAMLRLGVIGEERLHYWKLLFWTLFRRRDLLDLSIALMICGFHFRKVVKLHVQRARSL